MIMIGPLQQMCAYAAMARPGDYILGTAEEGDRCVREAYRISREAFLASYTQAPAVAEAEE